MCPVVRRERGGVCARRAGLGAGVDEVLGEFALAKASASDDGDGGGAVD